MRLQKLRLLMQNKKLDAVLISKPANRRYFSGFSGSAGMLVITGKNQHILTDFRYIEQAKNQAVNYKIVKLESSLEFYGNLDKLLIEEGVGRRSKIGFEGDYVTFDAYKKLTGSLPDNEFVSLFLDSSRMVKDKEELLLIKEAVSIADKAFSQVLACIKPGISEVDIALEVEYSMRKLGSEKPAFNTIIASGTRGSLPHGQASAKVLEKGDLVTLDFGAVYQGYHSDITRTVCVGKADIKQREIYDIVLTAQLKGLEAVQAGKTGQEVDAAAREVIEKAGYGKYFGHGLGHSVGLAVHESPSLSPKTQTKLEAGMTVTVEPGIYIPGWGGVRIEDLVVVLPGGREILTVSTKQLIEID